MILALQRRVEVDDAGESRRRQSVDRSSARGASTASRTPRCVVRWLRRRVEERVDDAGREDPARRAGWRRSAGLANLANPNRPKV